ncbi:hypothetical protein EV129_11345 [Rhizobium azibense]|uniref:Uncharacterized protein n=1 Tax=Rhizobium azibense TaxID=1136135 RepID=A0A4R3RKB8_9HYPH|nr:hypothetical protein [Rhizobium azibense]TCU34062.1 hypothetical protein EV129_11345 [Rhizobium azibense]
MTIATQQRQIPASSRTVIPFHTSTFNRDFEEPGIVPVEITGSRFTADRYEVLEVRVENFGFPLADSRLMDAGDLSELVLPEPENIFPNVFQGAHGARYILISIYCQHAYANLFYARRNVMV